MGTVASEKDDMIRELRELQDEAKKAGLSAWVSYPDRGNLRTVCTHPEGIGIADDVLDKDARYIEYVNPAAMWRLAEMLLNILEGSNGDSDGM